MVRKAIHAAAHAYPQNASKGKQREREREREREVEGWVHNHGIVV